MSESAVVYSLCGFHSVKPGTCQSRPKVGKGRFFSLSLYADFVFVFMRHSCVSSFNVLLNGGRKEEGKT